MDKTQLYFDYFIKDIRRRLFIENQSRIHKCLDLLSEDQVWMARNENVNSVGNLILHLCGNITQYVSAGIFRNKDNRNRDLEFAASKSMNIAELKHKLDKTMEHISSLLDQLTPEMLITDYDVQGFQENGTSILVHVTEHFSYHVGQITYLTKMMNDVDTGYYAGLDLNAKNT